MAKSFLGRVGKDSLRGTGKQFSQFVDESVTNPISLARNPQEKLNYNVAQNLKLADQGLISGDKSSVMAKSLFDAGQASSIQQGDLQDAYNRNRLKGNLQEELTLLSAGRDLSKESHTEKKTDKAGNQYERLTTRGAKQTTRLDEGLGGTPTEDYDVGTNVGEWVKTKNAPLRKGSGRVIKKGVVAKAKGKIVTYEDRQDNRLRDWMATNRAFIDNPNAAKAAIAIIKSGYGSDASKMDKLTQLEGVDVQRAAEMMQVLQGVEDEYTTTKVMTEDGTRELDVAINPDNNMTLDVYNSSGALIPEADLTGYSDKNNNEYFKAVDDKGDAIMLDRTFVLANKELMAKTFMKYGYHLDTESTNRMIEGEVKRFKGKAFVDTTAQKPTNTLQLFRANNKDNPSSIVARTLDNTATTSLYTEAARQLEAGDGGGVIFDTYSSDPKKNDPVEHNAIVEKMEELAKAKAKKHKGTRFTTTKGVDGKRDTLRLITKEVANATELSTERDRPTMLKHKADIQTRGNNFKVGGVLPNGESYNTTTTIIDNGKDGLSLSFDNGSGKEYKIPFNTRPDYFDELAEQFFTDELEAKYGVLPTNVSSKQAVKTLSTRGR